MLLLLVALITVQLSTMVVRWRAVSRLIYIEVVFRVPSHILPYLGNVQTLKQISDDWLKRSSLYVDDTKPGVALVDGFLHIEFAANSVPTDVLLNDLESSIAKRAVRQPECNTVPNNASLETLRLDHWTQRRETAFKPLDILAALFLIGALVAWVRGD
jgi:hypothetical protein